MSTLEIVKKALTDIEQGTIDASVYVDDMTFSGPVPQPLSREQYLGLMRGITAGAPDWNFHAHNYKADRDTVHVDISITGTQTRTLPGLMPGMPAWPPTNKRFTLPHEHLAITVRGDKISAIVVTVPPGGGVPGMLAQLGVPLPGSSIGGIPMSNKSISRKFFETYADQHDVEACTPLFSEDAVIYTSAAPGPMNLAAYKQLGYAFLAGVPDISCTVVEQLEDGDKVISRVIWGGTHTGSLNGIPPTGRSFRSEAILIDTVVNGKIKERREISDMLGMMQQLGVIPAPQRA